MTALPWPRACIILARLFLKRTLRSRVLWIMALIVSLPGIVALALLENEPAEAWIASLGTAISLLAIVPPVFAGGVVADELDEGGCGFDIVERYLRYHVESMVGERGPIAIMSERPTAEHNE